MSNDFFEKYMSDAVKMACEDDWITLKKQSREYTYDFSQEFQDKMAALIHETNQTRKKIKKKWKYLLIAAVIIVLNVSVVLANEGLQEKLGNLFMGIYEHYIELKSDSGRDISDTEFEKYKLNYVLNKYNQVDVMDNLPIEYLVTYENDNGEQIVYAQAVTEYSNILVSYEGGDRISTKVHGIDAQVVSDDNINTLIFEKDGYIFTISAPTQELTSELLKMGESISIWEDEK